jgi:FkbM family methyltransferase
LAANGLGKDRFGGLREILADLMGRAMLADIAVKISLAIPWGGYRFLALLSKFIPRLREYPIILPMAPSVKFEANLTNNIFFPLLKYGLYPHQVAEDLVIGTFLRDGDCVVDVGANIGYVSLLCSQYVGNGVVYSFEPSAITFKYIEQLASQIKQIKPWNLAVSNASGMVRFIDEVMSDRSYIADSQDPRGYLVQCCTIDNWVARNQIERIDFIKVDAEGHDIHVIEGAREVIKLHQPIFEFEAFNMDAVNQVYDILQSLKSTAGYKIYRCCNQYPLSTLSKVTMTNNWFAIPGARFSDFPDFLFRRGFLALTHFGTDA